MPGGLSAHRSPHGQTRPKLRLSMTSPDPDTLSKEEADRVWGRAAQLQADAAGDLQKASTVEADDQGTPSQGYALAHVRAAALEAGIADEFVEAALGNVRAERLSRDE